MVSFLPRDENYQPSLSFATVNPNVNQGNVVTLRLHPSPIQRVSQSKTSIAFQSVVCLKVIDEATIWS